MARESYLALWWSREVVRVAGFCGSTVSMLNDVGLDKVEDAARRIAAVCAAERLKRASSDVGPVLQ